MSIPRVLSIQSHMVSGYCGNKAATFPLQLLGFDVDVMNTVNFSNHTGYPSWTGEKATGEQLKKLYEGLQKNNLVDYSHILTGYIGSAQNLAEVTDIIAQLKSHGNPFFVLDPVMGDNGELYVQPDVIPLYRHLMKYANAITPNQFEAEILTDQKITDVKSCLETIEKLHSMGAENVVITSVSLSSEDVISYLLNGKPQGGSENFSMYCICSSSNPGQKNSRIFVIGFPTYDGYFTGTGDLFSALLTARLNQAIQHHDHPESLANLTPLARACIKVVSTMKAVVYKTYMGQNGFSEGGQMDKKKASASAIVKHCELRLIQSKNDIEHPNEEGVKAMELRVDLARADPVAGHNTAAIVTTSLSPSNSQALLIPPPGQGSDDDTVENTYDPPYHAPGLTDEEFSDTWHGVPNTLKIGVLLPFTPGNDTSYKKVLSRISLSVLRMAERDINERQVIPGMNISLVLRDSQQYLPGTNISGPAAAISATTRLMALGVGAIIGDISSEFTAAEAIMTSSVGIPQCSFSTYNLDVTQLNLNTREYLFRTVPGVLTYISALFKVIMHYNWKRISILYTSDLSGLLGEKLFASLCDSNGIDVLKVAIPLPDDDIDIIQIAHEPIKDIKKSDTRIHVLLASRSTQVPLLNLIRDYGLFEESRVWLTPVDLSDSINNLERSSDFNGLIMTDALWEMPGVPEFDRFVQEWMSLDPIRYPHPVTTQLTWHQTFAYTCLQMLAEGYKGLVQQALAITNDTMRNQVIREIQKGRHSQELTFEYLGSRSYSTPIGNITLTKDGDISPVRISIMSYQNDTSVPNGHIFSDDIEIFNPILFKGGTTKVPGDSPSCCRARHNHDGYPSPRLVRTNNGEYWVVCSSHSPGWIWSLTIGIIPALTILFGLYLAFVTRNVTRLWNEARSIALTIYVMTFFIIIIVIVQCFPLSLYEFTYYVTLVCVFAGCFLTYAILFFPKLHNLWLQKRGLHVAAGREDDVMSGAMGQEIRRHSEKSFGGYDFSSGGGLGGGGSGSILGRSDRASFTSFSAADMHGNPNISDLVSSYPFGQISGENNCNLYSSSPLNQPSYYGQSTLTNRNGKGSGHGNGGADVRGGDELQDIESLDLTDPMNFPRTSRRKLSNNNNNSHNPAGASSSNKHAPGEVGRNSGEALPPKIAGYDTFGRLPRTSRDIQPFDLHEALKTSTNRPSDAKGNRTSGGSMLGVPQNTASGMMGDNPGIGQRLSYDMTSHNLLFSGSDFDLQSRKSSFGGYIAGNNKPPRFYPLQQLSSTNVPTSITFNGLSREVRSDSFAVTVPVQQQRWYIMRILAQWRMSKIIFVPYSKLLVIIDLETETSESLIIHSIEPGYYSPTDYQLKSQHFNADSHITTNTPPAKHTPDLETREAVARTWDRSRRGTNPEMSEVRLENNSNIFSGTNNRVSPEPQAGSSPPNDGPQQQQQQNGRFPQIKNWKHIHFGFNQPSKEELESTERNRQVSMTLPLVGEQNDSLPVPSAGSESVPVKPSPESSGSNSKSFFRNPMSLLNRFTLNLGLDFRNMDGVNSYDSQSDRFDGMASDYIVRVISIHNHCWRVQLPDKETMERWVEIGQQIRDENWIARPTTSSKSSNHPTHMDRRVSNLDGGPLSHSTRRNTRSSIRFKGSDDDNGDGNDSDDDSITFDFPKPRPRPRESSIPATHRSSMPHPLQHSHEVHSNGNHAYNSQLFPQSQASKNLNPFHNLAPFRLYSDTSESSTNSNDVDRQKMREQAAKVNRQMKMSSRYAPFRTLLRNTGGNGSSRSGVSTDSENSVELRSTHRVGSNNSLTSTFGAKGDSASSSSRKISKSSGPMSRLRALPSKLRQSVTRSTATDSTTLRSERSLDADHSTSSHNAVSFHSFPESGPDANGHLSISEAIISRQGAESVINGHMDVEAPTPGSSISHTHQHHPHRKYSSSSRYNFKRRRSSANILSGIGEDMDNDMDNDVDNDIIINDLSGGDITTGDYDINEPGQEDGFPFPRSSDLTSMITTDHDVDSTQLNTTGMGAESEHAGESATIGTQREEVQFDPSNENVSTTMVATSSDKSLQSTPITTVESSSNTNQDFTPSLAFSPKEFPPTHNELLMESSYFPSSEILSTVAVPNIHSRPQTPTQVPTLKFNSSLSSATFESAPIEPSSKTVLSDAQQSLSVPPRLDRFQSMSPPVMHIHPSELSVLSRFNDDERQLDGDALIGNIEIPRSPEVDLESRGFKEERVGGVGETGNDASTFSPVLNSQRGFQLG
ncbi:hypothetical protein BGZ76_006504 [Entomortierella beljakovae]|nr:hypothetical protein BGZ76_006504 [Entomortierella beljakovae]